MRNRTSYDAVKADCDKILNVWKANADFKLKDVTPDTFQAEVDRLAGINAEIVAKEQALTPLRNERDDLETKLKETCVRVRAGIKGFYGPNSSQYEQAGGTRASERKKGGRKAGKSPTA